MPQPCRHFAAGCYCESCTQTQGTIADLRTGCAACDGLTARCLAGGPGQRRLRGCAAFTADGEVATGPAANQPWEARPLRAAA